MTEGGAELCPRKLEMALPLFVLPCLSSVAVWLTSGAGSGCSLAQRLMLELQEPNPDSMSGSRILDPLDD